MLLTGFEPGQSGIGSDGYANCATDLAKFKVFGNF